MGELMSDIQTTIDALATALATTGLQVLTELDYRVTPPAILIDGPERQTPTNLPETEFTETYSIIVVVPFNDQVIAQREIRPYLSTTGAKSIGAALMADQTLGGVVFGLEVGTPTKPGPVPVDEDEAVFFFGALIPCEVDVA
jgi:hypothetical protein